MEQVEVVNNGNEISNLNADISDNAGQIASNTIDISNNTNEISNNYADISGNAALIASNTIDISNNSANVASNMVKIQNITDMIQAYHSILCAGDNICSNHGICNTTSGTCVCDFGFNGPDCSHEGKKNFVSDDG